MRNVSRLRLARLTLGLSLDEVGQACQLDLGLLSRAERGFYRLTADQKKRIATALRMPEDILFPSGKDKDVD